MMFVAIEADLSSMSSKWLTSVGSKARILSDSPTKTKARALIG